MHSLFDCFIQNNFPLLTVVTRIAASNDSCGTVVLLLFVGFYNKIDVGFELLLVTVTMRFNEFPNRDNVDLVHAFFLSFYYNYTLPIN